MSIEIHTQRTVIRLLKPTNAQLMLDYYMENKRHLAPWEPVRDESYYTLQNFSKILEQAQQEFDSKTSLKLVALNKDEGEIIAVCNFTNIVYGAFQACNLGYSIAERYQGLGLMTEVLEATICYVFYELNLHRVMANYIVNNIRSERLLVKLGFEKEGLAKSYLKIAGKWQDHILTAKINPKHS
ncbi:ribosomal protein S5-alanine N-acetyltransferase [Francisella sp. 19X1-34]|uniref:ribosomal protein S5-alanine N-acetyltransferase n=1 Tax=Francisella sp. 19X1-34 TaxID=3087177 RepID=UPI002E36E81D|nr:ribosomal protein S5-alanine N-acetyltransferase [Francisella sp. 19X1-34]MED7788403.1 ribosomal protein S5-alanine N-acetyltransferase [Francisella sp. 19X1-34]